MDAVLLVYEDGMGSKRGTNEKSRGPATRKESNTAQRNAHDTSLNAGGRLKLPMNRID